MKKLLVIIVMALMSLNVAQAQSKESKKGTVVTTIFATDIDCESCERKILNSIPFSKGVSSVKVDIPTKRVTISYNGSKNSDENLVKEFKKIKVNATPIKEVE